MRDWLLVGTCNRITIVDITLAVYGETGVGIDLIKSCRHDAHIVRARHIVMYLAREITGRSYPQIGRDMGGKDHSGVMHGCRRIASRIAQDAELASLAERCKRRAMAVSIAGMASGV